MYLYIYIFFFNLKTGYRFNPFQRVLESLCKGEKCLEKADKRSLFIKCPNNISRLRCYDEYFSRLYSASSKQRVPVLGKRFDCQDKNSLGCLRKP